jgi:hypothetical protein
MNTRSPLPPLLAYCYSEESKQLARDAVAGWAVSSGPLAVRLYNPEGVEVSPNLAPADVRDAFRAYLGRS